MRILAIFTRWVLDSRVDPSVPLEPLTSASLAPAVASEITKRTLCFCLGIVHFGRTCVNQISIWSRSWQHLLRSRGNLEVERARQHIVRDVLETKLVAAKCLSFALVYQHGGAVFVGYVLCHFEPVHHLSHALFGFCDVVPTAHLEPFI